jgi:hypothetical protein
LLNSYLTAVQNLLQLPQAPSSLYNTATLTTYINTARGQLAGETECIRAFGTVSTVAGQQAYPFSSINLGTPATTGIQGVINVQQISYNLGNGQQWIHSRPWSWFFLYQVGNPVPPVNPDTNVVGSPPSVWSQYAQGAAPSAGIGNQVGGSFYLNVPDDVYALNCDCACYPIPLTTDSTPEAIPYLWTDAVPFFAAYYALLSSQMQARMSDALRYLDLYKEFVKRAREASNPSQLRWMYQGATDVPSAMQMGVRPGGPG